MPTAIFLVRAVVDPALRDRFDRWYAEDHIPWAMRVFKCEKAWRYWSSLDRNVHYALYWFADELSMDAALNGEGLKELIAEFDRTWPSGVTRTRDKLVLAQER
ncbi:MAG TPA: hypothetical protein VMI47_00070 [Pseudolabrys sp.]|nr:hypothetical protein [Pseudolabrys sp.]